ncbi:MAG TPA: transglycosylase domain-containing protein [Solirubrobacteraceae bacterium]|nr:transglycosylase domain-containing protein [Solirubrobacteraceae bacterium]
MSRRDRQRRRSRHRGAPVRRVILMSVLIAVSSVTLAVLALVGWVVSVADSAPNLNQLKPQVQGQLSQVFAANGQSLGYIQSDNLRTPVTQRQIPQIVREATVAIEDRRFYQHGALDYTGIIRAAFKDLFSGGSDSLQGASTLTMQLVRNLYLPHATRNLHYKIVQAKLAEQLFKERGRSWILFNYLNDVPYGTVGGQTAYGVGAASQMFFNKPVWRLNLAQSALLAGLPQAPSDYNPFTHPGLARQRRHDVLQAMAQSHYITQSQADAAEASRLQTVQNGSFNTRKQPYIFDYVQQQLIAKFCPTTPTYCPRVTQGGLKIYTTIDPRDEELARQAILAHEGGPGQPAAALVSINPLNGEIVAMATSATYAQTTFDYASSAHRSSGSSFKVFALMTLIHDYDGDPNSTYYNSHLLAAGWLPADPTWSVHTAELSYQGDINVTRATIDSDNTVFAQMAADLGWSKLDQTAHAMGITSPLDGNPAEVIGGLRIGVTPLEMADAYSTLASGGIHHAATAISRVVFPDRSQVNFASTTGNRVFPYGQVYAADKVLQGVVTQGTGTAANYGCPAAGKTGTSENLANAWFVGYTPQLSTAVWVGYPQGNIPMANGFGGTLAAPIWHDYMSSASNGYCSDFTVPTVPWQGQPFFGNFAVTGNTKVSQNNNQTGNVPSTTSTTSTTGTSPTGTVTPPTTTGPATGGGNVGAPPGYGNGHGHGGNGGGNHH